VQVPAQRLAPSPAPDPDEVLVERILRGDEDAFRRLYLRHSRYVAGVIVRLTGDDADLDDIVQDTFIRAADRIATLREPAFVRRWLVTIAVRICQGRLTRRHRRGQLRAQWSHGLARSSDPRDAAPADDLYAALDGVPDKLRIPWLLHRVEGEKLEDVARMCDVSLATAKRRIAAAQKKLDGRLGVTP
jgi:RNA polymerase sigma-70 factor (ECF subfamily)